MKAAPIPDESRRLVRERQQNRCARCLVIVPHGDWHHRRSRSVHDDHTHCPCNGVWLCRACHTWAHRNPREAMATGFIISRHDTTTGHPFRSPIGSATPDCLGGLAWA